jgi:hypothetical protein
MKEETENEYFRRSNGRLLQTSKRLKQGEIWFANLDLTEGIKQSGNRPLLIFKW